MLTQKATPGTRTGVSYRRRGASPENANLMAICRAQLTERLLDLQRELGRTPTKLELTQSGMHLQTLSRRFGLKVPDILISLGMTPLPKRLPQHHCTKVAMIQLLKEARILLGGNPRKRDMPFRGQINKLFGSWTKALEAAGLVDSKQQTTIAAPDMKKLLHQKLTRGDLQVEA